MRGARASRAGGVAGIEGGRAGIERARACREGGRAVSEEARVGREGAEYQHTAGVGTCDCPIDVHYYQPVSTPLSQPTNW